ncbi:oligosaccharide flippase family protein [Niveibacterium terrae]|uniref:oligosaccharide flippase family protein n=1 Tax=Niveibacterium terrae TaxID=3373598 RepID=UPI003A91DD78
MANRFRFAGLTARNTLLANLWQVFRIGLQFAYLVLVARLLGAEGYGVFSGVVALSVSLSPLVGVGFGTILIKEVSRSPENFGAFWAKALRALIVSAPVMAGGAMLLSWRLFSRGKYDSLVLLIVAAEFFAMPLISLVSVAYQANERVGRTMFNHVQMNLFRFMAVLILSLQEKVSLAVFAWMYLASTVLAAALSYFQVCRDLGRPTWSEAAIRGRLREGFGFSLSIVAACAGSEIDKALLLRMGTERETGNYSLASRVITAATMPLLGYLLAIVPKLFRRGEQGGAAAATLARKLMLPVLVYGVLAGTATYFFAPILLLVFGSGFSDALPLVRLLIPIPFLMGVSQIGLNVLSATDRQRLRVLIETASVLGNIMLNLLFIPQIGARGAVFAMLASQTMLAILPVLLVLFQGRGTRERVVDE